MPFFRAKDEDKNPVLLRREAKMTIMTNPSRMIFIREDTIHKEKNDRSIDREVTRLMEVFRAQ